MSLSIDGLRDLVIGALEDIKARDIHVVDVRGKSSITDIMVVATGNTDRQVRSLATHVIEKAKTQGVRPLGVEGERVGEWVLVDLGDVVVHIMQPEIRDFYNLEKLWGESSPDASAKV